MSWLKRILGQKPEEAPVEYPAFSPVTTGCLSQAGWQPGRVCDLAAVEAGLRSAGFPLHAAARRFLTEFHGLELDVPIDGFPEIRGFVHFAPAAALRFMSRAADGKLLSALIPGAVTPVGTASGHTMFLLMNDQGRCFLLDLESTLFAELGATPHAAIEALCDGRNGRVDGQILGQNGRPTGAVLREGDEQRLWGLEQYSDVAAFLPPVSLSPGRRPPTWRPVVKTLQKLISEQGVPKDGLAGVLVTNGGFAFGNGNEPYFVAHCENSLYVRRAAGVQVSGSPPGIPAAVRAGESFPFTPPS